MTMWAVTGGTGLVGRFIVEGLLQRGEPVVVIGRTRPATAFYSEPVAFRPFDLGTVAPDLSGCKALVHCAFDHVPGKYRGGEGDDPAGFLRRNVDGSRRLFDAAHASGVQVGVFLSSRAAYGAYAPGTTLREDMGPKADTLYGEAKLAVETALADMAAADFATVSLRATGVYGPAGPGQRHKWSDLFAAHLGGTPATARAGTELHGADLADAVWRCAQAGVSGAFNASDILLDRRDLLMEVNRLTGCTTPLPQASPPGGISTMDCSRLRELGWQPRGREGMIRALPRMLSQLSPPI